MKKFSFLVVPFLFVGLSAQAIYDPSWERPILEAQMEERDADGQPVLSNGFAKNLTLHQRDGARKPTMLTFSERKVVYCIKRLGAKCPPFRTFETKFVVESVKKNSCGTRTITGRELMNGHVTRSSAVIKLVDHTTDICEMMPLDMWKAEISHFRTGKRFFTGNPEGVITIQSAEAEAEIEG